jgi:hypothetical protein
MANAKPAELFSLMVETLLANGLKSGFRNRLILQSGQDGTVKSLAKCGFGTA